MPNVIRLPKKYIAQFQKREEEIYAYKSAATAEREGLYARLESVNAGARMQSAEPGSAEKGGKIHVVQQGESLGSIARMYRAYISQLIAWNNLKESDVTPGQKLIVFGTTDNTTSSQAGQEKGEGKRTTIVKKTIGRYRVKRGDSLLLLARKYNTTLQRLVALNDLGRRTTIVPGQLIKFDKEILITKSRSSSRHVSAEKHFRGTVRNSRSSSRKVSAAKHHNAKHERLSGHDRRRRR